MIAPGVQRNYEPAFSTYKVVRFRHAVAASGLAAGTYNYQENTLLVLALAGSANAAFYFDPASYAAGGRTTQLRLVAGCITNAVAPAITFTFHLYPVATWGGGSNVSPSIATVGASVGSVAIVTPAASGPTQATSADFAAPAAGWYSLSVVTSGTTATNSITHVPVILQLRQV